MTLQLSDLHHVRWSLFGFLLALAAASAAILYGTSDAARAQDGQQEAQRRLASARNRLATATADQANIKKFAPEYDALLERNVIGDVQRAQWVEGMERIRKLQRIPGLRYTIAAQQHFAPNLLPDAGDLDLDRSGMDMQFDLLHEGQLIDFLDALNSGRYGRFVLDHCALERSDTVQEIKAECSGGWLALKKREAG